MHAALPHAACSVGSGSSVVRVFNSLQRVFVCAAADFGVSRGIFCREQILELQPTLGRLSFPWESRSWSCRMCVLQCGQADILKPQVFGSVSLKWLLCVFSICLRVWNTLNAEAFLLLLSNYPGCPQPNHYCLMLSLKSNTSRLCSVLPSSPSTAVPSAGLSRWDTAAGWIRKICACCDLHYCKWGNWITASQPRLVPPVLSAVSQCQRGAGQEQLNACLGLTFPPALSLDKKATSFNVNLPRESLKARRR